MEANLLAPPRAEDAPRPPGFPYATWGAGAAVLGIFVALSAVLFLSLPIAILEPSVAEDDPSAAASVVAQLITAACFLVVPIALAMRGGVFWREALHRLGVRGFHRSAFGWMSLAVFAYLTFAAIYVAVAGEPEQEDIAEAFGPLPIQILLVVFAAAISEEICFRGMLFGGLRRRLPRLAAAFLSAAIFGALHAVTGLSAVPPLIAFGLILALLYEKTGSIVPGILLHMLNNAAALAAR